MYQAEVILMNEGGLHARPANLIVKEATKYKSKINIVKDTKEHNVKSIMGILSMGACKGTVLNIIAEGEDEKQAVEALKSLFDSKFGE